MAQVSGPYAPVDVFGSEYLVKIPPWVPLLGIAVPVVAVLAIAGGVAYASHVASGQAEERLVIFR